MKYEVIKIDKRVLIIPNASKPKFESEYELGLIPPPEHPDLEIPLESLHGLKKIKYNRRRIKLI